MHRRKIVLISGSGRTGSTLLSLLLSQHRDVFNLGQLRDFWGAWSVDAPCTCGHRLHACPVWSKVVRKSIGGEDALRGVQVAQGRFFEQARRLPDWSDADAVDLMAANHGIFPGILRLTLDAVQDETGAHSFVDASKSPEMALALSIYGDADVRVINLVRDPRAVAVSWRQRRGRISAAWKFSRDWADRQRRLERWSPLLGDRFRQVRYEDFAARPSETVADLLDWAGLPAAPGLFTKPDRAVISWEGQHLYPPANERVLAEKATEVTIRPSDGWRDPRHGFTRWLAMLGAGAEGKRYVG